MNNIILAFLLSFLAGLSTLIGYLPTYISPKYQNKVISFSLAFSAGVMISVSIFSLIPEAFSFVLSFDFFHVFLFFILFLFGIFISIIIGLFLNDSYDNPLYKVGLLSVFSFIFHNIP